MGCAITTAAAVSIEGTDFEFSLIINEATSFLDFITKQEHSESTQKENYSASLKVNKAHPIEYLSFLPLWLSKCLEVANTFWDSSQFIEEEAHNTVFEFRLNLFQNQSFKNIDRLFPDYTRLQSN